MKKSLIVIFALLLIGLILQANLANVDSSSSSFSAKETYIKSVGEEYENWWIYPELQPYQIFNAPQINWPKCKSWLGNHIKVFLEAKLNSSEEWIQNNEYLTVDLEDVGNNTLKSTWTFDAPITGDYRITIIVDASTFNVSKTGDCEYTLSLEAFNRTFNLLFNYSDLLQYSNLQFKQGRTIYKGRDVFYFRVRRDNIPQDTHVVLDPAYTVFTGAIIFTDRNSQRKLVRQSNGTLWCAFYENNDVHVAWSEDDGVTWSDYEVWGAQLSYTPSIAVDSKDVVHLVFVSTKNDDNDVQLEYSNSTDWTTIVQIRNEDKTHTMPSIAVDSKDNIHIVYEKDEEGTSNWYQVAYINSTDNGGSWGTEQILTDEVDILDVVGKPSIAINSTDSIHVVFMCQDHYLGKDDILHIQSDDYGDTWTDWEADPVYQDDTYDQKESCIAIDDNDKLHVVWYGLSQNTNDQIGYSHNDSSGWSSVEWVTWDSTLDYQHPSVSVNDNNYVHTAIAVAATRLNHSVNDTTSWTMDVVLTGDYNYPNMICAQHPTINGTKTNRPKIGYALICAYSTDNVTYYASSDLTWDTEAKYIEVIIHKSTFDEVATGNSIFTIVGVILIIGAIMSIVGLVFTQRP